jgi:hypothetical protein
MVKSGVLFEVRTEFLNTVYMGFGFRGLNAIEMSAEASRYAPA